MNNRAIFFDRDNTLIKSTGPRPAHKPNEVILIPGAREALYKARYGLGYKLFLFTNQAGVAAGHLTIDQVHSVNDEMLRQLALFDHNPFDNICVAISSQKELESDLAKNGGDWSKVNVTRKPSPRFINLMCEAHNLNLEETWIVGDDEKDARAGRLAGIKTCGVLTGSTTYETWQKKSLTGAVFPSIVEFVNHLETLNLNQT